TARLRRFPSLILRPPPSAPLFPTRRSSDLMAVVSIARQGAVRRNLPLVQSQERLIRPLRRPVTDQSVEQFIDRRRRDRGRKRDRSEEHTSELQSLAYLVCRLLLEKKKTKNK